MRAKSPERAEKGSLLSLCPSSAALLPQGLQKAQLGLQGFTTRGSQRPFLTGAPRKHWHRKKSLESSGASVHPMHTHEHLTENTDDIRRSR